MEALYLEFGRRLRRARKAAGLTQADLGRRVGLKRTSVTNIERGNQRVPLHLLFVFASAVGVRAVELLPEEPQALSLALEDFIPASALPEQTSDEEKEFLLRILSRQLATVGETESDERG